MYADNKEIVRRVFEAFNTGNLALLDVVMAADLVDQNSTHDYAPGLEGVKQEISVYRKAFPDLHFTIEDEIAEVDKVAVRYTVRATHEGDFLGFAPTGRRVTAPGLDIYRIHDGKIVQQWGSINQFIFRQQLGIIPIAGGT
jgi:steroid delta-isomerase-like uncharacterized protein